ncbi:hypothetical protein [Microbacterium sp.]|uniref:hypothetical protein n=1 Tax=Microbacterium sp. TaxID=51671 RepID=UPI0039E3BDED
MSDGTSPGDIARDPSSRIVRADAAERFHAGWRFVPDADRLTLPPWLGAPRQPDVSVDVVRGRDLVALSVDVFGASVVTDGDGPPHLARTGDGPWLMVVTFPFQHAHEEAQYVTDTGASTYPDPMDPTKTVAAPPGAPSTGVSSNHAPSMPVGYRPARKSRLVFAIGPDDRVEFTRAGILRAMTELEPVLHPNAAPPGRAGSIDDATDGFRIVWVGPDLVARYTGAQILVERATAADRRAQPPPDAATTTGALQLAQNLRAVRVDAARTPLAAGAALEADAALPAALKDLVARPERIAVPRASYSRRPTEEETAIEAPYRLVISPSSEGRWVHADAPVAADDTPRNVELWHSRLGLASGQSVTERGDARRIVRAIWTRDRDGLTQAQWRTNEDSDLNHPLSTPQGGADQPFRGSLNRADRHRIVRQTAERWPGIRDPRSVRPVRADKLWLSSLGAWLDLHGSWYTKEYSNLDPGMPSVLAWDHIAPLGRDQWVRVVYPGYLYPTGHAAALVKITERRVTENPAVASLYQIKFLVVSEPSRTYDAADWPFSRVDLTPTTTPPLADPDAVADDDYSSQTYFWPELGDGSSFAFSLDVWDKDGRPGSLRAPLLWVAEHFDKPDEVDEEYDGDPRRVIPAFGQAFAFTPRSPAGDSVTETQTLRFRGRAARGESTPFLSSADVVMDAARRLSNVGPIRIVYNDSYLANGLGAQPGAANSGQVWANVLLPEAKTDRQDALDEVVALPAVSFGTPAAGSDRAGGFVTPDLPIRGLSTLTGAVGDVANMENLTFEPEEFFKGAFPKLFGLVDLWELIESVTDLANMPNLASEAVEAITKLVGDIEKLLSSLTEVVETAPAEAAAAAQAALTPIEGVFAAIGDLLAPDNPDPVSDRIAGLAAAFQNVAASLGAVPVTHPLIPPVVRTTLASLVDAIGTAATATDMVAQLTRLLETFEPGRLEASFRYDFHPRLFTHWPDADFTLIELAPDGFTLAVEGRVSGTGSASVRAMAEIRGLTLHLFGKEDQDAAPLVRIPFENLSFIAGSDGKAEVDVNLGEITFLGVLSFVEVLKDFIPLDGFSDPPFLEVDTSGLKAGFTLPIPSVSVGVFNLSNISLGADVQVPFLGEALSFGFNFCTRERPFNLSVMCIGGGGWFLIRLNPKGLTVLELGLEAGVMLAVDFGVASGSISATLGIYLRLESEKGSLTGYFRLRGEVDVLGLISASIELYLELVYHFDSGKMIGTARLTIEVSVLCFSGSVTIECTRQFAGSKGDPSLRDQLLEPDGTAPAWDEYWRAFALEGA